VSVPPEQLQPLAPWSVLACQLLTIDGIWRTGGVILAMSPREAEAVEAKVRAVAQAVVEERERPPSPGRRSKGRGGLPLPDPRRGDLDRKALLADLVGTALPLIKHELEEAHARIPQLRNTDGEPLMLITARIEVADPSSLLGRMSAHDDFVEMDDSEFVWQGREMTRAQSELMVAQARAWAAERGEVLAEQTGPQRVTQAALRFDGVTVVAEVNSQGRLDRLMDALEDLGAEPEIVSVERTDPAELVRRSRQHAEEAMRAGTSGFPADGAEEAPDGLCPEAMRAWQVAWVDEPVPVLGGTTPRDAARHPDGRRELEVLLRELEHTSARRSKGGVPPIDVAALREELGMPAAAV
jgi:hypothetical protein